MANIKILPVSQGWASQAVFRVESSPSHFVTGSSRVRVESRIFPSRVKLSLSFAWFVYIFIENISNKFAILRHLLLGFYVQKEIAAYKLK